MNRVDRVLLGLFFFGWIFAPMIIRLILDNREIELPRDLGSGAIGIWYGLGILIYWWNNRRDSENRNN